MFSLFSEHVAEQTGNEWFETHLRSCDVTVMFKLPHLPKINCFEETWNSRCVVYHFLTLRWYKAKSVSSTYQCHAWMLMTWRRKVPGYQAGALQPWYWISYKKIYSGLSTRTVNTCYVCSIRHFTAVPLNSRADCLTVNGSYGGCRFDSLQTIKTSVAWASIDSSQSCAFIWGGGGGGGK